MGFIRSLFSFPSAPSAWDAPSDFAITEETTFDFGNNGEDYQQPFYEGKSNVQQKYPPIWETPYMWEAPDPKLRFIPIEQPANQGTRQAFNPYDIGVASYLRNVWKASFEKAKQTDRDIHSPIEYNRPVNVNKIRTGNLGDWLTLQWQQQKERWDENKKAREEKENGIMPSEDVEKPYFWLDYKQIHKYLEEEEPLAPGLPTAKDIPPAIDKGKKAVVGVATNAATTVEDVGKDIILNPFTDFYENNKTALMFAGGLFLLIILIKR
jgi:hypothetical protein